MNDSVSYYGTQRPEMLQFLPKGANRVLEVGCGEGTFRENFSDNTEYWGIEPFESAAKTASSRLTKVLNGTVEDVLSELPDGYFDLVICNDVIEHMIDHDWFFANITTKMSTRSNLVGSIPNVRFLPNLFNLILMGDWKYESFGILDRTHLRFFTRKSLIRTLEYHGFKIIQFAGINEALSENPTITRIIMRAIVRFVALFIGRDVLYLQYGFRLLVK